MMERYEIAGKPVRVTVRERGRGSPMISTIWDGVHKIVDGGAEYIAERSIVHDAGKMGVGGTYVLARTRPRTGCCVEGTAGEDCTGISPGQKPKLVPRLVPRPGERTAPGSARAKEPAARW